MLSRIFKGWAKPPALAARRTACPTKGCGTPELVMLGPTYLAAINGIEVHLEPYGWRCACPKCATVYAISPTEVYEVMEARLAGPAVLMAPEGLPAEGPRPSYVETLRRLGLPKS